MKTLKRSGQKGVVAAACREHYFHLLNPAPNGFCVDDFPLNFLSEPWCQLHYVLLMCISNF